MASHSDSTISDFDDQWARYTDNSGFYGSVELFADIMGPLLTPDEINGKSVVEVGSGTGRIVQMMLACGAREIYAVEPGPRAFAALQQNTSRDRHRIKYINARGEDIPAIGADLVVSIGVIHHIKHPRETMKACLRALRPGGKCLIWIYGKEGNELYLRLINPLRWITVRLPHLLLSGLCHGLNLGLAGYILLASRMPLPMRDYMVNVIGPMAWDKRYLVIYDQLNPAYAKYYTEAEARALLVDAGFIDVKTHNRRGYSWTVVGTRP